MWQEAERARRGGRPLAPIRLAWHLSVSAGTYPSGQRWFLPVSATLLRN